MSKAQSAWAFLTGLLIIAAVVLYSVPTVSSTTSTVAGSIFMGFGLFGWLVLLAMIAADAQAQKNLPE